MLISCYNIRHNGELKEGGVCPSERFLDPTLQLPPPINFEHDQISFYLALFRVRLG